MNERTYNIALEVLKDQPNLEAWCFNNNELEALAKLIIADCVKIAELKEQGYSAYDSNVSVGWYIKQHFGVKE